MEATDRRPLGVTAFFSLLGEQFVRGQLEDVARRWTYPCPIEVDGQLVVMRSPEVLARYLAERRAVAVAQGLTAFTPRISAIEMPRNSRFRVWLRWVSQFGDRVEEDHQGMVYFMAAAPDGLLTIEMMDMVHLPSAQPAARSA